MQGLFKAKFQLKFSFLPFACKMFTNGNPQPLLYFEIIGNVFFDKFFEVIKMLWVPFENGINFCAIEISAGTS